MRSCTRLCAALVALLLLVVLAPAALAAPAITVASGGAAISADTAASVGGSFTTLGNPSLYEAAPGEIGVGTLTLAVPAGFELKRQRVTVYATPGGSNPTSLLLSATADCAVTARSVYVNSTSGEVSVHVCRTSEASARRTRVTFSGLAVRPLAGTPLASGRLHFAETSTAVIAGVTEGPAGTSLGQLTEVAGSLAAIALQPAAATLEPGQQQQFDAQPADQFGNARADAVTWSADPQVGTIDATGLLAGGTRVADVSAGVTATAGELSVHAPIRILPGALHRLELDPAAPAALAGDSVTFSAEGFDTHDNSLGAVEAAYSIARRDGDPAEGAVCDGAACAATVAADYRVTATAGDVSASVELTVAPAALDRVLVSPAATSVKVAQTAQFEAAPVDRYGNVRNDAISWSADPGAGTIDAAGLLTAATVAGSFPAGVSAAAGDLRGTADVELTAGPVERIVTTPQAADITAGSNQPYQTTAYDAYDNLIGRVDATYAIDGGTCEAAVCGSTVAGEHTVTASFDGRQASALLTVAPAALDHVVISPAHAPVRVEEEIGFSAQTFDVYGNQRSDAVTFSADPAAGIVDTSTGAFLAGTAAGTYAAAVTASAGSVTATATVEVLPGEVATLVVDPASAGIAAGESTTFNVRGTDRHGNSVPDLQPVFGISARSGGSDGALCTDAGACTATRAGLYDVTVSAGSAHAEAALDVTAAELAAVTIDPSQVELTVEETTSFVGAAFDRFGNLRADAVSFSADSAAGTIDDSGLYTAGGTAGTFAGAVLARAGEFTAAADVTVKPGRVARLELAPPSASSAAGEAVAYTVEGFDAHGNSVGAVPADLAITPADDAAACADGACAATVAGDYTVTATHGEVTATAALSVRPAALARIDVAPAEATATAGDPTTFAATGYDRYGNVVTDLQPSFSLVATDGGADAEATCDEAGACRATRATSYRVVASDGEVSGTAALTVTPAALEQVIIDPVVGEVIAGGSMTFTAAGIDRFGNDRGETVRWSADPEAGSIDADSGDFTAGTTANFYPSAVTAAVGDQYATADVDILPAAVDRLAIVPEVSAIEAGDADVFAAEGFDEHGNSLGAVEASFAINPIRDGASAGAVCGDGGECTAERVGTYEVTASFEGHQATAELYIDPAEPAVVRVSPEAVSLAPGESVAFAAAVEDRFGNPRGDAVVWSADPAAGTIDAEGLFTAGSATGSFERAVSAAVQDARGWAGVTVAAGAVASIRLDPGAVTVPAGAVARFVTRGYDAGGNETGVVAAVLSSGSAVCEGDGCSATVAGSHTVTASYEGMSATAVLTVQAGPAQRLVVSPEVGTIVAGGSQEFAAEGFDEHGNSVGVVAASFAGAGVSCAGGVCTATVAGSHTVEASYEGATGSAVLHVQPAEAAAVVVTPGEATVGIGETLAFGATVTDAYGNPRGDAVAWSADPAAGTIDAEGVFTAGDTTGSYPAAVTAVAGELAGTADVTVTAGPTDHLVISPDAATIVAGQTQPFTVEAFDAAGNSRGLVAATLAIARDGDGIHDASCTADRCGATIAGAYTVTATADGMTAQASLTVTAGPVASVKLAATASTVRPWPVLPNSTQLTASTRDEYGNPVANASVVLSFLQQGSRSSTAAPSASPATVVTGADGTATSTYTAGGAEGRDIIAATSNGKSGSVVIDVRNASMTTTLSQGAAPSPL